MSKKKYNNKRFIKKDFLTQEEYDNISTQASAAEEILNGKKFEFFRSLLLAAKDYASTCILENTVKDVTEEVTISENIKKRFFTPKKVQIDELSGQYKLIGKIFSDLQYFIDLKKDTDKHISNERVIINE